MVILVCRRTCFKTFAYARKVKIRLENIKGMETLLKTLSLAIQNLETANKMKAIQINDAAIKIRLVVMISL